MKHFYSFLILLLIPALIWAQEKKRYVSDDPDYIKNADCASTAYEAG